MGQLPKTQESIVENATEKKTPPNFTEVSTLIEWLVDQMKAEQDAGVSGFEDWIDPCQKMINRIKCMLSEDVHQPDSTSALT